MGTNFDYYNDQERPVHRVTLTKPYCMDRTEVTQNAYRACQKAGKCRMTVGEGWAHHYPNYPADFVPWKDAVAYCAWRGGRLPTEAEWEFAARGTDGRLYPWGNEPPTDAHWQVRPKGSRLKVSDVGTHPKGRSPFGLDDMAGNVGEWVNDCWTDYSAEPAVDPRGPAVCVEPGWRVQRGASWATHSFKHARAALRYGMPAHDSSDQTGFRCAYDPR
jgi:formylglycine-generating enzyme required for sulfatase activity